MLTLEPDYSVEFADCTLEVFKDREAWWCRVECFDPPWQLTTTFPKACPQEALISGEMEILKTQALLDLNPACLLSFKRQPGAERILFQNSADVMLFGMDAFGMLATDFVDSQDWIDFALEVKQTGECKRTLLMHDADGKLIKGRVTAQLLSPPHFLLPVIYVQTLL